MIPIYSTVLYIRLTITTMQVHTLANTLVYVTGFAKRDLPHTFDLPTSAIHNFRHITAIVLQLLK